MAIKDLYNTIAEKSHALPPSPLSQNNKAALLFLSTVVVTAFTYRYLPRQWKWGAAAVLLLGSAYSYTQLDAEARAKVAGSVAVVSVLFAFYKSREKKEQTPPTKENNAPPPKKDQAQTSQPPEYTKQHKRQNENKEGKQSHI